MRPISVVSIRDLDCVSSVEIAFVEWDGWGLHAAHKSVNVIIIIYLLAELKNRLKISIFLWRKSCASR